MDTLTHVSQVVVHAYGTRVRRQMHETAPEFAVFDEVSVRRASLARSDTQATLLETVGQEHLQLARLLRTVTTAA